MISLDHHILDPFSSVANRMRQYGKYHNLDIIVPTKRGEEIILSDTVHVYGSGGAKWQQFFRLLKIGKRLQKDSQYEMITAQDPFLVGLVGLFLKKKPTILEIQIHGDFFGSRYYRQSGLKNLLYYYCARWLVVPRADKIRVVGERVRESMSALGVPSEKIVVQPIVVPTAAIQSYVPREDIHEHYPGFKKIFLFLGRFDRIKNIPWLLDVFSDYLFQTERSDLLLIAGDGSERQFLERYAHRLGIEVNVRFLDWIDHPLDYLKTVDAILIPSLSEGYGMVAMEAAAAGTRIIMTDVGVANYELKPSSQVTIVPVNDVAAFLEAMKV